MTSPSRIYHVIVLVARMLRDKGLHEIAQGSTEVRKIPPEWRFLLAGGVATAIAPVAEAMLEMGESERLRHSYARAARQKAEAVFSVENVVAHTFRVYDELLPQLSEPS